MHRVMQKYIRINSNYNSPIITFVRTCFVHHARPNVQQQPNVLKEYEVPGQKTIPHINYNDIELPEDFSEVYRDFLPNPTPWHRNSIKEKLERADMLARRSIVSIPEFYVGTIMSVTIADPNATEKTNKFLGICIDRGGNGLASWFILRNIIDHEGVEIKYLMYSPQIISIDVIKLEKRLDETLYYLRDCLPEYSYYPQNMDPIHLPSTESVPVNTTQAELKPRPWHERWERQNLKGVKGIKEGNVSNRMFHRAEELATPWEKYDLMLEYRHSIDEDEIKKIFNEIKLHFNSMEANRRRTKKLKVDQ